MLKSRPKPRPRTEKLLFSSGWAISHFDFVQSVKQAAPEKQQQQQHIRTPTLFGVVSKMWHGNDIACVFQQTL